MPLKLFCVKPVKYCYVDLKVTKPCKVWCFFNLWRNLNEVAISCGANWRISIGGTGAKNSFVQLIAFTIRRIHVFFHWLAFFFNTILRYLLEMSFQTHPPRLGWSSKV